MQSARANRELHASVLISEPCRHLMPGHQLHLEEHKGHVSRFGMPLSLAVVIIGRGDYTGGSNGWRIEIWLWTSKPRVPNWLISRQRLSQLTLAKIQSVPPTCRI